MHFNRIGNVWNQQMPKEKLLNTTRKPRKLVLSSIGQVTCKKVIRLPISGAQTTLKLQEALAPWT